MATSNPFRCFKSNPNIIRPAITHYVRLPLSLRFVEDLLHAPLIEILETLTQLGRYVIASESAGSEKEQPRSDIKKPWRLVTRRAELEGLRIHDLRHSFASVGAGGGLL